MPQLDDSAKLYLAAAAAALVFARWIWACTAQKQSGPCAPPGPRGLPILGNVLDIPPADSYLAFVPLSRKYGPIMQFRVLGKTIVVISELKAAVDLLDKRGAMYSGRPPFYMAWASGLEWHLGFMPKDDAWRVRRQMVHRKFQTKATMRLHSLLRRTALELARALLTTPLDFRMHIRRSAAANIIGAVYGIRVAETKDPYVRIAEEAMDVVSVALLPGRNLIDTIPPLRLVPRWVPFLGSWAAEAYSLRQYPTAMVEVPYARAKEDLRMGTARPCMVHENLERGQTDPYITEQAIKDACAVSYMGGADTTAAALVTFVMAMVLYPQHQQAAQAQLDRVLGDRLPDFADRQSLPYVEAIVRETYRRWPVIPLGVPHAVDEDDVYKGLFIGKGSTVMVNIWDIMHNEAMYPEPDKFNPGRWLKNGKIDETVQDPRILIFGLGRRICPGRHFADASVFLTIATVLKCFSIGCHIEDGVEMPPSGKIDSGAVTCPAPFRCKITPRRDNVGGMIEVALETCAE